MIRLPLLLAAVLVPARAEAVLDIPDATREGLIGSVVRSRRWNLRQNPSPVEEMEGDVVYKAPGRLVSADWALYDHASQEITARGNLRAEESLKDGTLVGLSAHHGSHSRKTGRGQAQGKTPEDPVRFSLRTGSGTPPFGEGQARLLRWDLRQGTVTLEGDVLFSEDRGQARAESAEYAHAERSITLSGRRPVLTARGDDRSGTPGDGKKRRPGDGGPWAAAVQADRIAAWETAPDRVRVIARGGARGWLYFPEQARRIPGRR